MEGENPAVARSLAVIAACYGFEGWLFNQETDGADTALAKTMVSFLADVAHGARPVCCAGDRLGRRDNSRRTPDGRSS